VLPNALPASTALSNAPPTSTALLNAPPAATVPLNLALGTIRQPIQPAAATAPLPAPPSANAPLDDAEEARKQVEMRAQLEVQGMMPEEIEEVLMDMEADNDKMEA
jgi:hypothetical protein